jgi:hypothetical protein
MNAACGLAILDFFEEAGDLVLAGRPIAHGISLDDCDFDFVIANEKQSLPVFFIAVFDCESVVGMRIANQLREFVEGW